MFKKLFIISSITIASLSLSPAVVLAVGDKYGLSQTVDKTGGLIPTQVANASDIPGIIGNVVAVGLGLVGVAFFLLALYAGITWMKAMGNTEDVEKAKQILEGAVIGLVLVMAAYAISQAVFSVIQSGSVGT